MEVRMYSVQDVHSTCWLYELKTVIYFSLGHRYSEYFLFSLFVNRNFLLRIHTMLLFHVSDNKQIFHVFLYNIRNYSTEVINFGNKTSFFRKN